MDDSLNIAISLPYLFSVRDFVFTSAWRHMRDHADVNFYLLCEHSTCEWLKGHLSAPNIFFVSNSPPPKQAAVEPVSGKPKNRLARKLQSAGMHAKRLWHRIFRYSPEMLLYASLTYRFSAIHNLSHYRVRKAKSLTAQKHYARFSDYAGGEKMGRPFPRSKWLFRRLYNLHHGMGNRVRPYLVEMLEKLNLDMFVVGRVHNMDTPRWANMLRGLNVPMVGIISSWDHPTTKGATPRGMSGYVVASKRMVDEMTELHKVDRAKIAQVGKVQMDIYKDQSAIQPREKFLAGLGVPADHRLITFGTNCKALKLHEVSIARRLAEWFSNGQFGRATLLLRTHPQDRSWKQDFLSLADPPNVICLEACSFGDRAKDALADGLMDRAFLANLMKHSDLVIQSRGSLALDAVAFDTPVINLAFDGDIDVPPSDSFIWEYDFEHYKPIMRQEGTWMVGSYEVLRRAVQAYLDDPTIHAAGRAATRTEQIEPLDGKAAERTIDLIVEFARQARNGTLPAGDWDRDGMGDPTWAAGQTCDIKSFIDT